MSQETRQKKRYSIINIIFLCLTLSLFAVGFFCLDSTSTSSPTKNDIELYIAKVDGEGISRAGFEAQVEVATTRVNDKSDNNPFIKEVRRNILSNQIDSYLNYKFSETLKTTISDEKVNNVIEQQDVFFENGKFNNGLYLKILSDNGYTQDSYFQGLKAALQQQQTLSALIDTEFVLPVNSDISTLKNQSRTVYTFPFTPNQVDIDKSSYTDEQLKNYYDAHLKDFYRKNESFYFDFISVPRVVVESKVKVTDEEIKNFYDENKKNYISPAKVSYSAIEFADKNEAENAYKNLLNKQQSFEALSEKYPPYLSQKNSKGELGWFVVDNLPDIIKQAHLTKNNTFSKPLLQDNGHYLIIRQDDSIPQKQLPLEFASNQIKKQLTQTITDERFEQASEKLRQLVKDNKSLPEIAKEMDMDLDVQNIVWLDRTIDLRNPFNSQSIFDTISQNKMIENGNPTDIISNPMYLDDLDALVIFKVSGYRPAGQLTLSRVKDDIANILAREDALKQFEEEGKKLIAGLRAGDQDANKKIRFTKQNTLTRNSQDLDPKVIQAIFDIIPSASNPVLYDIVFLSEHEATIFILTQIDTPQEVEDLSKTLLPMIKYNTKHNFSSNLRSKVNIEIMPNANM